MKERSGLNSEIKYFTQNRFYIFCISIISLICFGYAATNISISRDDLFGDYYLGSGKAMLAAGRFGMIIWSKLLGYGNHHPYSSFAIDVIAVVILILAAIFFCVLLRRVSNDQIGMVSYILFSCLFISYPLINEIWEYTSANICVCGGYLLDALSLLLVYEFLHNKSDRKEYWKLAVAVLLLMVVCSSYESLAAVYVFGVFLILAIRVFTGDENEKSIKGLIQQGMVYAGVLALGILIRIIVHLAYLALFNTSYVIIGTTEILWFNGTNGFLETLKELIISFVKIYFTSALYYSPITYMLMAVFATILMLVIIVVKYHKPLFILPVMGMLTSLVLLSLIQGIVSPYRTCQVFAIFVAVTGAFVPELLKLLSKPKWIIKTVCVVLAVVCVHQAVYLSTLLVANNMRSNEEAYVVNSIAHDLESDTDLSKPIIFTGSYSLSDEVLDLKSIRLDSDAGKLYTSIYKAVKSAEPEFEDNRYKYIHTNINSVIDWSLTAFQSQVAMQRLFHYYGTDYIAADYNAVYEEAQKYVDENLTPAYPETGYIVDVGDYIIVNLK